MSLVEHQTSNVSRLSGHLKHTPNDHNMMIYDATDTLFRYISDIEFTLDDHLCMSLVEHQTSNVSRLSGHLKHAVNDHNAMIYVITGTSFHYISVIKFTLADRCVCHS